MTKATPETTKPRDDRFFIITAKNAVEIVVPAVGEGNPAAAFALEKLIAQQTFPTKMTIFRVSVLLARIFHRKMSRSEETSSKYSKSSEKIRSTFGPIVATAIHIESKVRQLLETLNQVKKSSDPSTSVSLGILVQEFSLGKLTDKELKEKYPLGAWLYVPDVYPKYSALSILKTLPYLKVIVWNNEAQEWLIQNGIEDGRIELWSPVLPFAFIGPEQNVLAEDNKQEGLIAKSSGSGIPAVFSEKIEELIVHLIKNGAIVSGRFYYPDEIKIFKHPETEPKPQPGPASSESKPELQINNMSREKSLREKIESFYLDILRYPPSFVISYPSEMIQVIYTLKKIFRWEFTYIALPPRGDHEVRNLEWATAQGLVDIDLSNVEPSQWIAFVQETLSKDAN